MYQRFRTPFLLITLLLSCTWGLPAPKIILYILPFENIENDPSVDWLRAGMTDMLNLRFADVKEIGLRDKDDLEELMSNRNRLLHQPRGTKNFLLLGKFERKLDEVRIGVQLIDIATWEEVDRRSAAGYYSKIPELNDLVVDALRTMLVPYLPAEAQKPVAAQFVPETILPEQQLPAQVREMGSSIDLALDDLEESMDLVIGARGKPSADDPIVEDGEWVLDISGEDFTRENPELTGNTQLLMKVLDDLTNSPYNITLSKPRFEYNQDQRDRMNVVLPVKYALKEHLIRDMLSSLPYSGLKQDGSLTIFYFNRDKFNFPPDAMDNIKYGDYRAIPVIRFFDNAGKVVVLIADSPEGDWGQFSSDKVVFIPTHHFSPLIIFTVGGWSIQVAMETVDIPVEYQFALDVDDVSRLSRVSLKFVPENELKNFLLQNL
ncbi:MAG: hypothetical protein HQ562_04080 [Candidatus Marinimicrobia bacterium]|nr:hypothetical protein [Candidatus Neomarinimicrobiota bacterium]